MTTPLEALVVAWPAAPEDRRAAALAALRGETAPTAAGRALTVAAVARRAGVSRDTVYRALDIGALHRSPLYAGGRPRIAEVDVDRWVGGH